MTKTELSKLITDYGDFRVEANTLDELRNYETELVNRLYEAINCSHCCETLKDEEVPFEEWKKLNGIVKSGCGTAYTNKNQDVFQEWELIDMYNCEVMNL